MKGLGKRDFYGLRENFWLSPARENLPQAIFLALKDGMGNKTSIALVTLPWKPQLP